MRFVNLNFIHIKREAIMFNFNLIEIILVCTEILIENENVFKIGKMCICYSKTGF